MFDNFNSELKQAMLAKDKFKVETFKMLKSSLVKYKIDNGVEIDDQIFVRILQKEIKSRQELAELYLKADQKDRAENARQESEILEKLLPEQLSTEEVKSEINRIATASGIEIVQANFGQLMNIIKAELGSRTDGSTISKILKSLVG